MLEIYIKLFLFALIPVALSAIIFLLQKTKYVSKIPYIWQQVIIGIIFGGVAIIGTEFGVDVNGAATANVRDAGPLCAGLIFGGPAGIIAGVIGGVERFFAAYWGKGMYSQIACSISTILAGVYAALIRKFIFEKKRPVWGFGLAAGIIMEVVHLTILLLTKMSSVAFATHILKLVAIPMIVNNGICVCLSCLIIDLIEYDKNNKNNITRKLSTKIQLWLLAVCTVGYIGTTAFVVSSQNGSSNNNAVHLMEQTIQDVKKNILNYEQFSGSIEEQIIETTAYRHVGKTGFIVVMKNDGTLLHHLDYIEIKNIYDDEKTSHPFSTFGLTLDDVKAFEANKYYQKNVLETPCYVMCENVNGFYVIAALPTDEVFETRDAQIFINSFLEVIVFAALFAVIYLLIKMLVVNNVVKINETLGAITEGDLQQKVDVKSSEEFESLGHGINHTVDALKDLIAEAAARIDKELAFAKSIQSSALPSVFPAFPHNNQFDIYATMNPAKEVGGDFYDMYMIDNDHLCFLIADVSGKGIPAAMFMMESKTMLKNFATSNNSVDQILIKSNDNLCQGNEANMFVTCWIGILNIHTGLLKFANAGHNYPAIYRKDKKWELVSQKKNFVLGGMPGIKYNLQEIQLEPGDKIFIYTDGVTEATRGDGALYGDDRLIKYLNEHINSSEKELLEGVQKDIDTFVEGADQFDDITMLTVDYFGDKN